MSEKKRGKRSTEGDTKPWTDVVVETCTTIKGGCLAKPLVIETKMFPNVQDKEFVQIRKGEQWLISASLGSTQRQQSLKRTKIVEDIASAAIAAVLEEEVAEQHEAEEAPAPHDPMQDMAYDDLSPEKEQQKQAKDRRLHVSNRLVKIEMPAVAKELNQDSTDKREVTCYVQSTWHRQVLISL